MNIMICGSRENFNRNKAMDILLDIAYFYGVGNTIHLGGARGIDKMAEKLFQDIGTTIIYHLPDYERYGRRAPLVRNMEMVDACDRIVAFWNGKSRGTAQVIAYASKNENKFVEVYNVEETK